MAKDFLNEDDATKVQEWRVQWDRILRDSVIVSIHASQWQPYTRLNPDRLARLGVNVEDEDAKTALNKVLRGGRIDLVPSAVYGEMARSVSRARRQLKTYSYEIMFGRVVPANAYEEWREKHADQERRFWDGVDYLCTNMERIVNDEMRIAYTAMFNDSYSRLKKAGAVKVDRRTFVLEGVEDIMRSLPHPDKVRSRYAWETTFRYAPMADELAASEARAAEIRAESMLTESNLDSERKVILERMQADVAAQAQTRKKEIERSLAGAEDAFYASISETVKELKDNLTGSGRVGSRSAVRLRNLITRVRALNVFDDEQLTRQMTSLEESLETRVSRKGGKDKRADAMDDLRAELDETAKYVRETLASLPTVRGVRSIDVDATDVIDVATPKRRVADDLDASEATEELTPRRRSSGDASDEPVEENTTRRRRSSAAA